MRPTAILEGNEAAAHVAYRISDVIAIYPITPSSPMGEYADQWSAENVKNMWGHTPRVIEMQSEGGAAGALHGALQAGNLCTTFTASQGLLLMLPNMFKIAGELTPAVIHIAARSIAAQGLSIFGDHADVMAARTTGWAILFSNSVQEVADMSLVAHAATLEARIPILNCFDGFRTSHELQKAQLPDDDDIRAMIDPDLVRAHRERGLNPDSPTLRGTAQNPDTYFQGREASNPWYNATPEIIQNTMDKLAARTGRPLHLFDYVGHPEAEHVVIAMGSGCEALEETQEWLNANEGAKCGLIKVRLFRPFSIRHFLSVLPATTRTIGVLDRTKEPGASGEPLYQEVLTALCEALAAGTLPTPTMPRIIGGRYGLSSKEFTPAMCRAVYRELSVAKPKNHFTVGILDDVTHTSLDYDADFDIEHASVKRAVFWGLGSDGTVGANKNSIKIIGENTNFYAQGYFVYDSKKAGARTVSHLRFGPEPIRSTYLISKADFIAVHQFNFLSDLRPLEAAKPGATLLLNSTHAPDVLFSHLPRPVQQRIIDLKLKVYTIDAWQIAAQNNMKGRINTVMQACYFHLSGVLPPEEAVEKIKLAIKKTYGKRGDAIVKLNCAAVDASIANLHEVPIPATPTTDRGIAPIVPAAAPDFVQRITAPMLAGQGDLLPVSALPADGVYPTATTRWEKRNIAHDAPLWEPDLCIQCGKCIMVCPHSVIRGKTFLPTALEGAPEGLRIMDGRWRELPGRKFTIQVSVEDCTGCSLCVEICPAKDKSAVGRKALNMVPAEPIRDQAILHWDWFNNLPDPNRAERKALNLTMIKDAMLLPPTFEFSSACAGCGETPYLRLLSQLFGDRAVIANATGCSSIYGGNLPTTPWSTNQQGCGPAWANSLFEDNAEFGLGMYLGLVKHGEYARTLLADQTDVVGAELVTAILEAPQVTDDDFMAQRERLAQLRGILANAFNANPTPGLRDLIALHGNLLKRSLWIIGGDGWAYDIGFGGLDHVLASGENVNILVLDTEVYSNTGGQASKSTALGAVAKFATGGKLTPKKDLGLLAMSYGHVYVAHVAMGANDVHTLKAFREAEAYQGPSLILAYSHCIAHGIEMTQGLQQQKLATQSGHWPLYRFDPRRVAAGQPPFQLDSKAPSIPLKDYIYNENRYRILQKTDPETASRLLSQAQAAVTDNHASLERLAAAKTGPSTDPA